MMWVPEYGNIRVFGALRADGVAEDAGFLAVPSMSLDFDFGSEAELTPTHRTGSSLGFGSLPSGLEDGEGGLGQGIALVVDAEVGEP